MSRVVVPPCTKDCPRRRAQPNCHNREYCPEWGEFEDAEAARKTEKRKQVEKERDIQELAKETSRKLKYKHGKR